MLRRLCAGDLIEFQAYRHDEEVALYQSWSPLPDSEATSFLDRMASAALFQPGEWFQIAIADRKTDTLIGDIGICVASDGDEAEIGFTLRAQSQGIGLGTEAVSEAIAFIFEQTSVNQIVGITDERNLPCIHLMERLGMRRVSSAEVVFRGDPCVELALSLSRPNPANKRVDTYQSNENRK